MDGELGLGMIKLTVAVNGEGEEGEERKKMLERWDLV